MRLTPFAKFFVTIVILVVVGYAVYHYKGADVRKWATGGEKGSKASSSDNVSASDFNALKNAPPDPSRDAGSNGVQAVGLAPPRVVLDHRLVGQAGGRDPMVGEQCQSRLAEPGLGGQVVLPNLD